MDALGSYLVREIIRSAAAGNLFQFLGYVFIFLVLWLEVRGLKKAVLGLTSTVGKSFAEGEKRFQALEENDKQFEHRLTLLESKTT